MVRVVIVSTSSSVVTDEMFSQVHEAFPGAQLSLATEGAEFISQSQHASGEPKQVVFIDAEVIARLKELSAALPELTETLDAMLYVRTHHEGIDIDFPGFGAEQVFSPEQLPGYLQAKLLSPRSIVTIPTSWLQESALASAQSLDELALSAFLYAQSSGEEVRGSRMSFSVATQRPMSDAAAARILKASLTLFNLEEIFPSHPWRTHETESAAAAYHFLAARFMAFQDFESAHECIVLSESLEESPRACALRALISVNRGDVLSALADMILSLRGYESRKNETGSHYLTFKPANFDAINEDLKEGLAALNAQRNAVALNHFANAVFAFDPFYRELGLNGMLAK